MNIEQARFNMVEQQIRPWDVLDITVLDLLMTIPREAFVPEEHQRLAFADLAIPLAHGQFMLSPKLEARLVQDAEVKKTDRVLEIGTGAAYTTALLAHLARDVVSIDIIPEFTEQAREKLAARGITNVTLETGDAARGWEARAPYDVIVMTGSQGVLPQEILAQLAEGGRFIGIIGDAPAMQAVRVERRGDSFIHKTLFESVVPRLVNAKEPERFVF